MKSYEQMILANKAWVQEVTDLDPDFFRRQARGQKPDVLWIGCSDSRVSPEQLTQTMPGEMFIHRNIANLVHADDLNFMSVLQYAVTVLKVPHIIVCGHYGCGGIRAVLEGGVSGAIEQWLRNAHDVCDAHADELARQPSDDAKLNRLVECNVRDQIVELARTDLVRQAWAEGQPLQLHGWVYDLRDGHLKPLVEIDATTDLDALDPEPPSVLGTNGAPELRATEIARQKMPEGL